MPECQLHAIVCERDYRGSESHFGNMVAAERPPQPEAEAHLHLKTLCGEKAQGDWATDIAADLVAVPS